MDLGTQLRGQLTQPNPGSLTGIGEVQVLSGVDAQPATVQQLVDDPRDLVLPARKGVSWATTSSRLGAVGPPTTRLSTQYCGWVTSILAMASRKRRVTASLTRLLPIADGLAGQHVVCGGGISFYAWSVVLPLNGFMIATLHPRRAGGHCRTLDLRLSTSRPGRAHRRVRHRYQLTPSRP